MHLEELINQHYSRLNENDFYIWEYMQNHRQACEHLSIEDLALQCHVSRSTILRFAKRLGLKGYAELKVLLRMDNAASKDTQHGIEHVYSKYNDYMKELKEKDLTDIISFIANAKNAYVFGTGTIQNNVAAELKRSFLIVDKLFFCITSANESFIFADLITQEDVIVMISYSGENEVLLDFAQKLKARNVPIIAITVSKCNTLSHIANASLFVDVANIHNPLGPRYEGLVNYFILIDFLLVKYISYHETRLQV